MLHKKSKTIKGQILVCNIPKVLEAIPIIVVFRALGYVPDKEILELCCYDKKDKAMMELLRASFIDGSFTYQQEEALSFIATKIQHLKKDAVKKEAKQ